MRGTYGGATLNVYSSLVVLAFVYSPFASFVRAQSPTPAPAPLGRSLPRAGQQHFACYKGYAPEACQQHAMALSRVLDRYQTTRDLPDWTWVFIRSDDWQQIKRRIRLDPNSPAFTSLKDRETFFEEALFARLPLRRAELVKYWSRSIDDLLELAVTHELGHVLCGEEDEHRADDYGRVLRSGGTVRCKGR